MVLTQGELRRSATEYFHKNGHGMHMTVFFTTKTDRFALALILQNV